ncbi:hypothetical protein BC830DRAFT_1107664 [Chytriomyces sp. MP71]|nr:hypothetical protein BC830DRAFT_1107664 [Chytriomyces sp. MP71]
MFNHTRTSQWNPTSSASLWSPPSPSVAVQSSGTTLQSPSVVTHAISAASAWATQASIRNQESKSTASFQMQTESQWESNLAVQPMSSPTSSTTHSKTSMTIQSSESTMSASQPSEVFYATTFIISAPGPDTTQPEAIPVSAVSLSSNLPGTSSSVNFVGAIVGGVIACVGVVFAVAVFFCIRKRQSYKPFIEAYDYKPFMVAVESPESGSRTRSSTVDFAESTQGGEGNLVELSPLSSKQKLQAALLSGVEVPFQAVNDVNVPSIYMDDPAPSLVARAVSAVRSASVHSILGPYSPANLSAVNRASSTESTNNTIENVQVGMFPSAQTLARIAGRKRYWASLSIYSKSSSVNSNQSAAI